MSAARPLSWNANHDKAILGYSRNGEDLISIEILMETEFPTLAGKLSDGWIGERLMELERVGGVASHSSSGNSSEVLEDNTSRKCCNFKAFLYRPG